MDVFQGDASSRKISFADLNSFCGKLIGVMINPGWFTQQNGWNKFQSLPILKLCPSGFLFVWIPKSYLQRIWKKFKSLGFLYVESLTWIQLNPNGKVLQTPDGLFSKSHITLYIFRRGGRDIEIKHQRSSDVVFDFDLPGKFRIPNEAYNAIEIMLPNSEGKLLELWSTPESDRNGWIHVCESEASSSNE